MALRLTWFVQPIAQSYLSRQQPQGDGECVSEPHARADASVARTAIGCGTVALSSLYLLQINCFTRDFVRAALW